MQQDLPAARAGTASAGDAAQLPAELPVSVRMRLEAAGRMFKTELSYDTHPGAFAGACSPVLVRFLCAQAAHKRPWNWLCAEGAVEALVRVTWAAPFLIERWSVVPAELPQEAFRNSSKSAVLQPFPFSQAGWGAGTQEDAEAHWMREARIWKYANLLRITVADLMNSQDTAQTCAQLSTLADEATRAAYAFALAKECARHGLPCRAEGGFACGVVIAMGKWGGRELNYASDVDFIFLHEAPENPCRAWQPDLCAEAEHSAACDAGQEGFWAVWEQRAQRTGDPQQSHRRPSSAAALHNRVARRVVRMLGTHTAEGFLFRPDNDLRPLGRGGMLACGIDFLEEYYERFGREWERAALLKARPLIGPERLRQRFGDVVRPFVYRRYMDYGALEGLAIIKHDIGRVGEGAAEEDLKLGPGGIRENEFWVQALQLLHGGRMPVLRVPAHDCAVERLRACGLLTPVQVRRLRHDYWLLRRIENRVQMLAEMQTHRLPKSAAEQCRVLHDFRSGFSRRLPRCLARLRATQRRNARRFAELFAPLSPEAWPDPQRWRKSLLRQLPAEQFAVVEERATALFERLMRTREGERCVPKLARLLAFEELGAPGGNTSPIPAWLGLAEQIGNRNALYALLISETAILRWAGRIFAEGGQMAENLRQHPEFLESFFTLTEDWSAFLENLRTISERARDDEEFLIELRTVHAQALLRIYTVWLHAQETNPGEDESHRPLLQALADAVVEACLRRAWRTLLRGGAPAGMPEEPQGFAVLALGKLGGQELRFHSDLDLLFLYRAGEAADAQRASWYTRLAQRLCAWIGAPTQLGHLYALDHRLRPFGTQGVLVPSLDTWRKFLDGGTPNSAEIWNYQAFTRLRFVAGEAQLGAELRSEIGRAWALRGVSCAQVIQAVQKMLRHLVAENVHATQRDRLNLKYDSGGLVACEFLAQAQALCAIAAAGGEDGRWLAPQMPTALRRDYTWLGALDERLGLHEQHFEHELRPEHYERLPALEAYGTFSAQQERLVRLRESIADGFGSLSTPS